MQSKTVLKRGSIWVVTLFALLITRIDATAQTAFSFENWRGYFTTGKDGKFKACFTEATYSSGDKVQFWLTPEFELYFSLHQKGEIDPNQKTARIWVDASQPLQASIEYLDPITVFSIGPLKGNVARLFEAIRMGNILSIEIGGNVHKFSLRGTYGALSELAGCANFVRQGQPPPALASDRRPSPSTSPNPANTASTKSTEVLAGSATAFSVSTYGHLLTNAHALEECREVKVSAEHEGSVQARVIAVDKRNDLALLTSSLKLPPLSLRRPLPRLGEPIYAFGFPLRTLLATSGNFTAGMVSALVGINDDSSTLQMSAPVQPGNSGGPLLDSKGNVVGIVASKLDAIRTLRRTGDIPQNVNFAIKASVALTFLEAHSLSVTPITPGTDLSPSDVADLAMRSAVRVDCYK